MKTRSTSVNSVTFTQRTFNGILAWAMKNLETATFAGGCFWCTEAIFKRLKGVQSVTSGYSGGKTDKPSYEQVSSSNSGHAESIQIKFGADEVSFEQLLEIFFKTHDPTTVNQQGNDIGSQYRSGVFYHDEDQKKKAEEAIKKIDNSGAYSSKVVTEVTPYKNFFEAEDYHKDYYDKNKEAGYCKVVIDPKITKLYRDFGEKIKDEYKKDVIVENNTPTKRR